MGQSAYMVGGAIVGGVIGYYSGNTSLGIQLGAMAGGIAGALLNPGGGGPRLSDLQVTSSGYGGQVPLVYGTVRIPGNVIWASDLVEKKTSTGKGGGSGYSYRASWAVGLCEGPVSDVTRIWCDGKLVYDKLTPSAVSHAQTKQGFVIRIYLGTEDQVPDWVISDWVLNHVTSAPLATPAYRGLCYVVFDHCALGNFANRVPSVTAEVVGPVNQQYASAIRLGQLPGVAVSAAWDYWQADLRNQLAYSIQRPIGTTPGAIVEWNLVTNAMSRIAYSHEIFVDDDATDQGMYIDYTSMLAIGAEGDLYLCCGANLARIVKVSGRTLRQIPYYGTPVCNFGTPGYCLSNTYRTVGWARSMVAIPHAVTPAGIGAMLVSIAINTTISHMFGPAAGVAIAALEMSANGGAYQDWLFVWTIDGIMILDRHLFYVYGDPTFPGHLPLNYGGPLGYVTFVPGADPLASAAEAENTTKNAITAYALNTGAIGDELHIYEIVCYAPPLVELGGAHVNGATVKPSGVITLTDVPLYAAGGWSFMNLCAACYDATDNSILIVLQGAQYVLLKWRRGVGVIWHTAISGSNVMAHAFALSHISAGQVGWGDGINTYSVYETQSGTLQWRGTGQPADVSTQAAADSFVYDGETNSLLCRGPDGLRRVFLNIANVQGTALADVISDVCQRSDLAPAQVDVSRVTDTVQGYPVNAASTGRDILTQLLGLYQIDCVESDGRLKFLPRGGASVASLTQDDLADGGADARYWNSVRTQEMELPFYLTLKFSDPDLKYQPGAAYSKRIAAPANTMFSKKKTQVEAPLVMTSTVAHQMAERILWTLWEGRTQYSAQVGWKWLWLDPADPVTVSLDNGDVYSVRLTSVDTGADLSLKLEAASEDQDTYSSQAVGAISTMPVVVIPGIVQGRLLVLDVPLLRDIDAQALGVSIVYYGAGSLRAPWTGGTLYTSADQQSYTQRTSLPDAAVWGTALDQLGDTGAPFCTDRINTVTIVPGAPTEALSSIDDAALLAGGNMAVLGQEVIQFRDVALNADGTATLSVLLRGRRGTDWATSAHAPGDTFVLLDAEALSYATVPRAAIGTPEWWKLVPTGAYPSSIPASPVTPSGADLRPYGPLNHTRAMAGGDLVLGWTRRTRISGDLADGTGEVPLAESYEAYEAYALATPFNRLVFDPAQPATFRRAFLGLTSPTCTYSAAEMAADGFDPTADTLHLVVFQLSEYVGRGFPGASSMPAF